MCGIAGWVDLEGAPPDEALAAGMANLLAHRGPDGAGARVLASGPGSPTVVVGHRRLAVIDLSDAATQPLSNEDGTASVVFNGEIYNFLELRRDLEVRGHAFRSRSDTEVIVHAYEEFGDGFVARLDGMFAFALWDGRNRRLILARDRVGKKPLYYAWDGRRLAFASETKALRLCDWVNSSVAWDRLPAYLALGYAPWPETMHRGLRQVPPASIMVLEEGALSEPREYWRLTYSQDGEASQGDRSAQLRTAAGTVSDWLRGAVERRLVADVPLGVLLSGGLDSSAIVAFVSELGVRARTFSVGIGDETSYDERRFARLVADRFRTEHTEIEVRADASALLEQLVWFLDQPLADSSAVPTYLIARAAREHVTVVLTGDGGDETFGGYERFAAALLADGTPHAAQRAVGAVAGLLPRTGGYHGLRQGLERFARDPDLPVFDRYLSWIAVFDRRTLARVLTPELAQGAGLSVFASYRAEFERAGTVPLLHRLLSANLRTYLHDDLLVKTDRMMMANSLEARSPLLDTALLEDLAALPPWIKATPFGLKRVFRRAMRDRLPRRILLRRKHGFGVPVGKWFRGELRGPFEELVLDPGARTFDALQPGAARALLYQHLSGRVDHGPKLWSLLVLEVWLRQLERSPTSGPPPHPDTSISERTRG